MYGTPQFATNTARRPTGSYFLGAPLSPRARRIRRLAAITPDQAAQVAMPSITKTPGFNQAAYNVILSSVQAGQILDSHGSPAYIPGTSDCSATGVNSKLQLASTATGLALTGVKIASAFGVGIATVAAPFTLGISSIVGLFPLIFGHHAQAVKKEQSVLCSAVPAANNYLQIIDQAVQTGQATPAQGVAALQSLLSDFRSQVSSILKMSSSSCNAACVMYHALQAIVAYRSSLYQDMAGTAAPSTPGAPASAPGGPAANPVAAVASVLQSAGLPSWLLPAAGFFLLYEVL